MKYIHYWRFNRQWYMKISETPDSIMISGCNEDNIYSYIWQEKYLIPNSLDLTHKHIKDRLHVEYPDYQLVKEVAYHEGRRWYGEKHGSRS